MELSPDQVETLAAIEPKGTEAARVAFLLGINMTAACQRLERLRAAGLLDRSREHPAAAYRYSRTNTNPKKKKDAPTIRTKPQRRTR